MTIVKPSEDKKRIREAAQAAELDFWSGIPALFPETFNGDFDIDIDMAIDMQAQMEKWIKHWLELNEDPVD